VEPATEVDIPVPGRPVIGLLVKVIIAAAIEDIDEVRAA
jgi:hypothetical protein